MNTPRSGRSSGAPTPRPRPACVPPLPDLSLLLSSTTISRAPPRPHPPTGRLHAVDPKPRPLLLDRPYEVGGARHAATAIDLIPPPQVTGKPKGVASEPCAPSQRGSSSSSSRRSRRGQTSSTAATPTSSSSSRAPPPMPIPSPLLSTAKHSNSSRSVPTATSSCSSAVLVLASARCPASPSITRNTSPSPQCPPPPVPLAPHLLPCAGDVEPKVSPLYSFRSSTRHSSPLTARHHCSPAFRGLTPRIRPATAASHQPDTAWLNGVIAGKGPAAEPRSRAPPSAHRRRGHQRVEESKEALEQLPAPQRSRTAEYGLAVDPDEFLAAVISDPQRAFRMISTDYPIANTTSPSSNETRGERRERLQEEQTTQVVPVQRRAAAPASPQLPFTASTPASRYQQTGLFDVQRAVDGGHRALDHVTGSTGTAAFVTHFAPPADNRQEEEPLSGGGGEEERHEDDDVEDTRQLIRQLVRDAQRDHQAHHQAQAVVVSDDEIEDELHHVTEPDEVSACDEKEEERDAVQAVELSPPSPTSVAPLVNDGRRAKGRPPSLAPPERTSALSSGHLSPSSFTIASSAPASPAIHSDRSANEAEEFSL